MFFIKMELPEDVVAVIKEFAQPVTHPDWRTLHKMPYDVFHISILEFFNIPFYYLSINYYRMGKKVDFQYKIFNNIFTYRLNQNHF